jgi:hypothetical protein
MPFGEVTLSWDRNGEADLAGYRVYAGTSHIVMNPLQNVGLTPTTLDPERDHHQFPDLWPVVLRSDRL